LITRVMGWHIVGACPIAKERQHIGRSMCPVSAAERTDSQFGYLDGNVSDPDSEECSEPHSDCAPVSGTPLVVARINASRIVSQVSDSSQSSDVVQATICCPTGHLWKVATLQWTSPEWEVVYQKTSGMRKQRKLVPMCHYARVRVKLGTYDGSKCLEAFLANVSLQGPAGQLL